MAPIAVNFFVLCCIVNPFGTGNFVRFGGSDFGGSWRSFPFLVRPITGFFTTVTPIIVFDRLAEQYPYVPPATPSPVRMHRMTHRTQSLGNTQTQRIALTAHQGINTHQTKQQQGDQRPVQFLASHFRAAAEQFTTTKGLLETAKKHFHAPTHLIQLGGGFVG